MKTIGEVLKLSASFLEERKVDRARRSAEELLSHTLKIKRMDLYLQYDKPVEERELSILRELLKKKAKGEPLEYATGEVDFLDCRIKVDRRVLIPRPETEILASLIVKRLKGKPLAGKILWDLCTGSGCLGIALKKALPELTVVLSDVSKDALSLARENASGLDVELLEGDLLTPFQGRRADFIVCNPPYVSQAEYLVLDPSVRDFEPKAALVGGEKGTEYYERLQRDLPSYLNPGAQAFFEIGSGQGEAIKQIFSGESWSNQELLNDWAGHPRFFFLENQVLSRVSCSDNLTM